MKKIIIIALFGVLALNGFSAEFANFKVEDVLKINGKELKLNGMGIRKKMVFNVYAAFLYLEQNSSDAQKICAQKDAKVIDLYFMRDVEGKAIAKAIEDSFRNNAEDFEILKERLEIFKTYIPNLSKKDMVRFVFRNTADLEVYYKGEKKGEIKGHDFSSTLLKVWLGEKPVEDKLKKGLLGIK